MDRVGQISAESFLSALISTAVDRAIGRYAAKQNGARMRTRTESVTESGVVNETQLHAKGSSLGHCPTKVTSGLDMVILHSSTDTFAPKPAKSVSQPASQPASLALEPSLSSFLALPHPPSSHSPVASLAQSDTRACDYLQNPPLHQSCERAYGRYLINNVPLITVFHR